MKKLISLVTAATLATGCLTMAFADGAPKYTSETTKDGWIKVVQVGGTTLGYSADSGVTLLEDDGYAFKDLNKNGELDVYEDWRLPASERAVDLATRLGAEDIIPLMGIDMQIEQGGRANSAELTDEQKEIMSRGILEQYGGAAANISANVSWVNAAQAFAEARTYGIPVGFVNDPFTTSTAGVTHFPTNLAIAATFDPEVAGEMGRYTSKVYRALGITTLLGPQIDISTEPRWRRTGSTFGEDPALSADMARAVTDGLQSTYDSDGNDIGWGKDSVNAMLKHWPGDGAAQSGRESHKFTGTYCVYPGDNFDAHLISFVDGGLNLDGLTGSATAVMPSYSIAFSESEEYGELVGSGFSEYKIGLLRSYGFDGVICTDWEIIGDVDTNGKPWGVEDLTVAERVQKAIMAGCDQIGAPRGFDCLFEGYQLIVDDIGEEDALARIRESARRILTNKFLAGSFDNPYLSLADSTATLKDKEAASAAADAMTKSIIMLKNDGVIKENTDGTKPTVYIPLQYTPTTVRRGVETVASIGLPIDQKELKKYFNIVTDTISSTKTGPADSNGNPTYSSNDIIRASAEELKNVDFAIVFAVIPSTNVTVYDNETGTYLPISMQYGPYTANSLSVPTESTAGKIMEVEVETPYGTQKTTTVENLSYFGNTAVGDSGEYLDIILDTAARLPEGAKMVVCENGNNAICFGEFEEACDAILIGFGVDNSAFLNILSGKVEPSGLLPIQMPADMDAVEEQEEDVPRDMDCYVDAAGNTYDFAYGLNWSGVINDERVEKYGVEPLTEPVAQPVE